MNRRNILFANLVMLLGFAAGYAAAYFTVKTTNGLTSSSAIPVTFTQQAVAPTEAPVGVKEAQPATIVETSSEVIALQAQLAEKNARIHELQQKANASTHETLTPEDDSPEYREKLAGELMELTKAKDMIQQSFQASAQMIGKDLNSEGQEALNAALQKHYSWDKLEKSFSKIYTEVFSAQELSDMTEFYRTEVGASMLKKQPDVMQKTLQVMSQINQEIQPKLQADLEAIMKKSKENPVTASSKTDTPTKY